jgi:hypothetical protein
MFIFTYLYVYSFFLSSKWEARISNGRHLTLLINLSPVPRIVPGMSECSAKFEWCNALEYNRRNVQGLFKHKFCSNSLFWKIGWYLNMENSKIMKVGISIEL